MSDAANYYWRRPESPNALLRMEDVGTRQQHITDLLDIWNGAFEILSRKTEDQQTEREKEMTKTVALAIELLKKHLTGVSSDYHEQSYQSWIDELPKDATQIKDEETT